MSGQNREVVAAEVPLGEVPSLLSESEKEAIAEAEAEAQQAVENQRTDERIDSMAYNNNHRPMLANDIHEHGLCMAVSLSLQSLWRTLLDIVAHLVVFFMLAQFSWQSVISVSTGPNPPPLLSCPTHLHGPHSWVPVAP